MLSRYFGFQEEPFGATPDPRWLYRSAQHREALASLRHGFLSNRGFTSLIAPPGLGKTTLLFQFLHDIRNSTRIVFLFDTQCEPLGLLRYILRDLGIAPAVNGDEMHMQLEDFLVKEARAGRRVVVVVDEAQNLSDEALEMLRLLTNYETPRAKLLHIVLSGQPLLADTLMKPSMEQLRQRVTTSCWLEPFSMEETTAYIRHRLEQAGYRGAPLFRKEALRRIMVASHGIPRLINNLCFNALSLCCEQKLKQVDGSMAADAIAIQELDPEARKKITGRWQASGRQPFQPEESNQPEQRLRPEQPIQREKLLQPELQAEEPHHTGQLLRPEQPIQPGQPLQPKKPLQGEKPPPREQILQHKQLLQPELLAEQPLRPEQPAQAEEPKPVLRRLMVPVAAVLLAASGVGLFSLSAGPHPWFRLAGYIQSLDTKVLSAPRPGPSKPNISAGIVAAPSSKPSPLNTNDLSASIPTPATANIDKDTITEPPVKTTPSAAKAPSPPTPAPAVANIDRATVAEPPAKTTPSATKVVSPPVPAPAVANTDRVTVAEPLAKIKPFQITAGPNETLHDICVRYLGIWDLKYLHEIQALNPDLTDLDHLQAGQKIWLPAPEPAPAAQPSSAQAHLNQTSGASSNTNVKPSAATAAARNPAGGNRGAAESPHVAPRVAHAGLPGATAGAGSYGKVAPAGIPGVVKGTARLKMPVAPVPAEMLPKPAGSSNPAEQDTPNCGGVVEMPCPTLQTRPTSPPD